MRLIVRCLGVLVCAVLVTAVAQWFDDDPQRHAPEETARTTTVH